MSNKVSSIALPDNYDDLKPPIVGDIHKYPQFISGVIERIGFLGGASWKPTDQAYIDAFTVAKELAQANYEIVNGGGPGVMEAATLGAKAGGAKFVLVITYRAGEKHLNYESITGSKNTYDEEIITIDYFDRTKVLLQNTDVHIVFNGSTGTLSELGMSWASSRIHEGHHKPIILYGDFWNEILDVIDKNMLIRPGERELMKVCTTPKEVVDYINNLKDKVYTTDPDTKGENFVKV